MRARYDEIVREKTSRIQQYKQAVAGLIAQRENKVEKIKSLTEEVNKLENLKSGALSKAKTRVKELQAQGLGKEEIQQDAEYAKCQGAFRDFSSTLSEKQARIEELEHDIGEYATRISEHKVQLTSLLREVDKLKAEAADAVADVITAREEKEIADTLAGIAQDGTSEELQRMRQLRQEIKAEAHISKELAGTDHHVQEAEFLAFARDSAADDEFAALIGLAEEVDSGAPSSEAAEKEGPSPLPE
jgi:phage shock protein A